MCFKVTADSETPITALSNRVHNNSTGRYTDDKVWFVLILSHIWSVDYSLIRIFG